MYRDGHVRKLWLHQMSRYIDQCSFPDTSHQPDRWHCIQCGRGSNEPSLKHDPPYPSDRLKLVLAGSRWIIGFLLQRREQYRWVDHKQNLGRIYLQACALR